MLAKLYIKNVALIDELKLDFNSGFNVLTGETGAGKSIIIDSIELILGGRADKDLIKSTADFACVEAEIQNAGSADALLEKYGIPVENVLALYRELNASGKNSSKINGKTVSASVMREIAAKLINIYGQNSNQMLFSEEKHLEMLDSFFADELAEKKEDMRASYSEFSKLKAEAEALRINEAEKQRMLDMLDFQINEISSAALKAGEEEELVQAKRLMMNSEKIAKCLNSAKNELYDGETNAKQSLYAAMQALNELAAVDDRFSAIESSVSEAYYSVEDAAYELGAAEIPEFSERELEKIDDRLAVIKNLKRKYGANIGEILEFLQDAEDKRKKLENSEQLSKQALEKAEKARKVMESSAQALSEKRKELSHEFASLIEAELKQLGMGAAEFETRFEPKEIAENGCDAAAFYITVNRGEPLKPLSKVASGGEASRIMLALKTITAGKENIGTLIFDEVDTGISGKTAHIVAEKIAKIAHERQVICVTHLPHIAAVGDTNFLIEKFVKDGRTHTTVKEIKGEDITREIARLSGGIESKAAMMHAEELLENARELRKKC